MRDELQTLISDLGIEAQMIVVSGDPPKAVSGISQSERVHQLLIARGAVTGGWAAYGLRPVR